MVAFIDYEMPIIADDIIDLSFANKALDQCWTNIWLGQPQLGLDHLIRARRLDPSPSSLRSAATAHAYFFLNRYEEALSQAEQYLWAAPDAHGALRIGAASAAFAGRRDTAQRLAAHLLHFVDPAFRVSRLKEVLAPYQQSVFVDKYSEGLLLAGLPE
jgi:adenylate cyclase